MFNYHDFYDHRNADGIAELGSKNRIHLTFFSFLGVNIPGVMLMRRNTCVSLHKHSLLKPASQKKNYETCYFPKDTQPSSFQMTSMLL